MATILSTDFVGQDDRENASDSADLDLSGNLLAVANQAFDEGAFGGVSLFDVSDALHPTALGRVTTGGVHDVQIDPGYPDRPFVYAANFESVYSVSIINVSNLRNPVVAAEYVSPEPQGCYPQDTCEAFNSAHDLTLLIHPDTGRVLLYVAYWDSGLRIVDVTDARNPREVGSLDYTPTYDDQGQATACCAHYAQPTPSGRWVLLEDEIGIGLAGDVHILKADGCDGVQTCTLTKVSDWSPPGAGVQAAAIHAALNTDYKVYPNGVYQRFFTRDVHNLDVQEDQFLAAAYSSGIFLVNMKDKAHPYAVAFWQGATEVKTACHGKNTLIPWGYQGNCYFQGREVWAARFGERVPGSPSDFYIYASDFWDGFLVLRTVTLH